MKFLCAVSIFLNFGFVGWLLYASISSNPELANKEEWSVLQFLSSKHRNDLEPPVILAKDISKTGYDAAGFVDKKTSKRVWILTNSKISPRIKLMPSPAEVDLTDQQIADILNELDTNQEVKAFLSIRRH
jgi:hypothetical protein